MEFIVQTYKMINIINLFIAILTSFFVKLNCIRPWENAMALN